MQTVNKNDISIFEAQWAFNEYKQVIEYKFFNVIKFK
jgi:hypothetical protein